MERSRGDGRMEGRPQGGEAENGKMEGGKEGWREEPSKSLSSSQALPTTELCPTELAIG